MEAITSDEGVVQRHTLQRTHWRQLGCVAYQQQTATWTGVDELNEVVEQPASAIRCPALLFIGNHRRLVNDKQSLLHAVETDSETGIVFLGLLSVDAPVDGIGWMTCT